MSESRKGRGLAAEYGLVCAWFAVSFIIVGVLTFAFAPMRAGLVVRSVNGVLEREGERRRLSVPTSTWGMEGRAALAGARFSLDNARGGALVFTMTGGGVVANCVALIDETGRVDRVLPLGSGSAEAIRRLPSGLVLTYTARIEESERMVRSTEKQK